MKLFVGQARLMGPVRRYAQRFDMVELRADAARLPRLAKLRSWRDEAGPDFVFSLVIGADAYEPGRGDGALEYAGRAGEALQPAWWVLRSPASVTPAASMVRRLGELIGRLPKGPRVAWEPSGPWDAPGSLAVARELGVHLVRDGSRDVLPDDEVVYTRLRALGEGANVSLSAAEHLADELHGRREAYVIVEGEGAGRVRAVLASELEVENELEAGNELDGEDEEADLDATDGSEPPEDGG